MSRSLSYNSKHFLTSETHPDAGTITYGRDNVGNMTSRGDSSGTRDYTYDGNNRLTRISSGSGTINFAYDGANNRTSMTGPSASISYTYDSANRLTRKSETISGAAYSTDYSYDGNDNITDIYYPTDLHITYGYNSNNEVTSVIGFGGSVTSFNYNLAGLPTSFNYSNGKNTSMSYNSRYFTTRITSSNVIDIGYTNYDSRGNVKAITDYRDSEKNQSFNYDSLDRLTSFNGIWGSGSFTYSSSGNRQSKSAGGSSTTYLYSSNRLSSASGAEAGSYSYFGNGNLKRITELGVVYDLDYDGLGNLIEFSSGGSPLAEFRYDGDGMRVKKIASGKTTIYHYDQGGRVISETDDNGVLIADYIYASGKLVAKIANSSCTPTAPNDTTCDGVDDDYDGSIDDDYVITATSCGQGACSGNTGQRLCQNGSPVDTCDPFEGAATDDASCNGIDDDCNGAFDEDYVPTVIYCGVGECLRSGLRQCSGGVEIDVCTPGDPGTEGPVSNQTCVDRRDNDCDGSADFIDSGCSWTDPSLTSGLTLIKAVHFTELRSAINNVRLLNNMISYPWTNGPLTPGSSLIDARDLTELRIALGQALTQLGKTAPDWQTNPDIVR